MRNQPTLVTHSRRRLRLAAAAALSAAAAFVVAPMTASAQKPPEEAVKSLKVADGLEVTTWASEPQFVNPTNIDVDARGRVWVLESANYRGSKARPEGDRIMILEDTDQDGRADKSTVFYQDKAIVGPLGIHVMGDKVYVAQSPNLLVFTIDASGDKPAGPPTVLLTGFTGENHDHGLHAGVFGPDGRYYFNAGNDGMRGLVKLADGTTVVDSLGSELGGKATQYRGKPREKGAPLGYQEGYGFRCDVDGKNFETLGFNFRNNYELTVDSFGTVWQSDNDDDGNQSVRINYVMEGGDFGYKGPKGTAWSRDQALFPGQTRQEAHWHLRWPGVVPNLLNTGGGSPCGITVYEGTLLPEKFRGALLHADAGPNVIRAYITSPSDAAPVGLMQGVASKDKDAPAPANVTGDKPGAGYKAEPVDLLKSQGDNWFRPCDVCVAPDGSVFVADWYDPGVGGHATGDPQGPKGQPKDWRQMRGRIYRVAPPGFKPAAAKPNLDTVDGQIAALKSPNFATRYLAWTKLNAGGAGAVKALEAMYANEKDARLKARALWLLARSADGKKYVEAALSDENPDLRITALRAARLIKLDIPAIADRLTADASPQVLREVALAMNYQPADKAVPVLVKLADRYDGKDRWYLEAIGIGANGKEEALLAAWQKDGKRKDEAAVAEKLVWRLKRVGPEAPANPTGKQAATPGQDAEKGRAANAPFPGKAG